MKRIFLICGIVFFLIAHNIISVQAHITPAAPAVLKSASELDYPPFALVRSDGTADGFSVDLLKAVTKAVGRDVSIAVGPWHELKQQLADGNLDILPLVSYSLQRDKIYDFTIPYLQLHGTVFVRKGNTAIKSIDDLQDKEVLVMRGDTAHEYALAYNLSSHLILTDSFEQAMKLLAAGRHDAVVIQQLAGLQLLKKLGINNVVPLMTQVETNLKPASVRLEGFQQKFCLAVPEGQRELLAHLNEGLALVIANGTYDELYQKWFSPILPKPSVALSTLIKYVVMVVGPILLLCALSGIWYLKRQVTQKTREIRKEFEERQLAEKELQKAYDIINVSKSVAFLWKNEEGWPVEFVTDNVETLTGYSAQEFMNGDITYAAIVHPDDLQRLEEEVALQYKGGTAGVCIHEPYRILSKDLGVRWVSDQCNPRHDQDGRIIHYQGIVEDITNERNLKDDLLQAQKMEAIGTLAGGIAHDFNNILSIIIGYSELLEEDLDDHDEEIKQILSASMRASELVKQILTFSRKTRHFRQALFPHLIVKEALKMMRSSLPQTITIEQDIDSECGQVNADPTKIHQIVMNLCANAMHAMEHQTGVLTVALHRAEISAKEADQFFGVTPGQFVVLSVRDTGQGMGDETRSQIFDPYFTTKPMDKGTGLGLAVIHGIISEYNGFIEVESEPGMGTIFKVHMPALEEEQEVLEYQRSEVLPMGTERILLVDDESAIVAMYAKILINQGYQVTSTTNSREALEKIRKQPDSFDLLVTDQTMPDLPGSELTRQVLKINPDLPVILCTGYSSMLSEEEALGLGIKKYVLKPLSRKDLTQVVRSVLDGK